MVFKVRYVITLLIIEIFILGIFYSACHFSIGQYGMAGMLVFFLFIVCIGGFGIAIFVSLSRSSRKDFFINLFIF